MNDLLTKHIITIMQHRPFNEFIMASNKIADLSKKPIYELTASEFNEIYDFCSDLWRNESPDVESYDAEQDKGIYPVTIKGIPGVYWIFAPEYDNEGPFDTLEEARKEVEATFGEFLVGDTNVPELLEDEVVEEKLNDQLLTLLARSKIRKRIELTRNKINANPEWQKLGRGHPISSLHLPRKLELQINTYIEKLPKTSGYIAGMSRQFSQLPKLRARALLFYYLNEAMPDDTELSKLFNVSEY